MSTTNILTIVAVWVVVGVVTAFVMRRRGHDFWLWFALGVVLGPLLVPLAIERARYHRQNDVETANVMPGGGEGFDVLAGVDGSEESVAALRSALNLFAPIMSSLTIATVLDYDSRSPEGGSEARGHAREMLERVKTDVGIPNANITVLFGRPDQALVEHARAGGVDLIVVGGRGRGASEALFGSVTGRLVGGPVIPVYVGPASAERSARSVDR